MDGIALVFVLSVLVEKLVQLFKDFVYAVPFLPDKFRPLSVQLLSLACGIVLALGTGLNALELMHVPFAYPQVGMVITGLVIGRGSNFAHDVFSIYESERDKSKTG